MQQYSLLERFDFLREDRSKIIKLKKGSKKANENDFSEEEQEEQEEQNQEERAVTANKLITKYEPVLGDKYHEELENMDQEGFIRWLTSKREIGKNNLLQTNYNNNYREKSILNSI